MTRREFVKTLGVGTAVALIPTPTPVVAPAVINYTFTPPPALLKNATLVVRVAIWDRVLSDAEMDQVLEGSPVPPPVWVYYA